MCCGLVDKKKDIKYTEVSWARCVGGGGVIRGAPGRAGYNKTPYLLFVKPCVLIAAQYPGAGGGWGGGGGMLLGLLYSDGCKVIKLCMSYDQVRMFVKPSHPYL